MVAIDWAQAIDQTGNDELFLEELLQDLFSEFVYAKTRMIDGIASRDFESINNAAILVQDGSGYLYCEDMVNSARQIRNACEFGHINHTWTEVERLFEILKQTNRELLTEVSSHRLIGQNRNYVTRTGRANSDSTASLSDDYR